MKPKLIFKMWPKNFSVTSPPRVQEEDYYYAIPKHVINPPVIRTLSFGDYYHNYPAHPVRIGRKRETLEPTKSK